MDESQTKHAEIDDSNDLDPLVRRGSATGSKKPERTSPTSEQSWLSLWLFDFLAIVSSIVCTAVNMAVLTSINGKPLASWKVMNVRITPNALISIFSTLSKGAMLFPVAEGISQLKWSFFQKKAHPLSYLQTFDDASRGPLGAIKLIRSLKLQAALASLGATITVLALAVDPFTQQILSYPTQHVNATNMTTSIPITRHYRNDIFMDHAILQGLFAPDNRNAVQCPTSECTWPAYKSLGICSSCKEIGPSTEASCTLGSKASNKTGVTQCMFLTSTNVHFEVDYWTYYPMKNDTSQVVWSPKSENVWYVGVTGSHQAGEPGEFVRMTFLAAEGRTSYHGSLAPKVSVTTCSLSICEQTYTQSRMVKGTLEAFTSSSVPLDFGPCHLLKAASTARACPGVPSCQAESLHDVSVSSLVASDADVYWVYPPSLWTIAASVADFFKSEFAHLGPKGLALPTSLVDAMISFDDISRMMSSVAKAMTDKLREAGDGTRVHGQVLLPEVFVKVRWAWFAYPVILLVLSISFWIATVASSHKQEKNLVWKSSSLTLLFHRLQGWSTEYLQEDNVRDIDEAATGMSVRLTLDEQGSLGFVRSNG